MAQLRMLECEKVTCTVIECKISSCLLFCLRWWWGCELVLGMLQLRSRRMRADGMVLVDVRVGQLCGVREWIEALGGRVIRAHF